MRNVRIVAAACALAGGGFWIFTASRPRADPGLPEFLERANAALLAAAAQGEGPEAAVLTIVLGGSLEGKNPLHVAERPKGIWARLLARRAEKSFVYKLSKAGYPLGWNPVVRLDPADEALVDGFARILVKAGQAGVPVRILAQGDSVLTVYAAARSAAEVLGKPAVSRFVATGVSLSQIKAKLPKSERAPMFSENGPVQDWVHLWIDPRAVPSALNVESREQSFARDPGEADWEKFVIAALERGPAALVPPPEPPPSARPFRDLTGRTFEKKTKSSLEMLKEAEAARAARKDEPAVGEIHPVRNTGWVLVKSGLEGFQFIAGHEAVAFWARGPHRIDVLAGERDYARETCARAGREAKASEYRRRKVAICANAPTPEDGRPQAHHDYFTISDGPNLITVAYMYATPRDREKEMDRFRTAIGALFVPGE